MKVEIKTQGLYFFVMKDFVRISEFFSTEEQAVNWIIENNYDL